MKTIQLTHGKVALIDDEDYDYLNQWKWSAHNGGHTYYAQRHTKEINGKRVCFLMHRVIMRTTKEMHVDHKDHNGLNNQKSNLRNCLPAQNFKNRSSAKNKTSKYLGVCLANRKIRQFSKKLGKIVTYECEQRWRANIWYNNRSHSIGQSTSEIEAAKMYDESAKKIHGEFANLNFK